MPFNRTSLELKRVSCIRQWQRQFTFNRTSLELKLFKVESEDSERI